MTEKTPETEQILVLVREYAYAVKHAKSFATEEWALDVIKARIEAFGRARFDAGYEAGADYEPGSLTP